MKRMMTGAALAIVLLGTAACKREATGQVAAVVNGEDITLQEINAEIGKNLPDGIDKKAVQAAALQRVIDRRLLAKAAKDDGLDESADYLIRSRQVNDALLAQLLNEKVTQSVKIPSPAETAKFIASHPWIFANRTVYTVDRIQFGVPANPEVLRSLEPLHTIQEVMEKLKSFGIRYAAGASQIDSARMPKDVLDRILALPPGEPFITPEGINMNVAVITGSTPVPMPTEEATPLAVELMRKEMIDKTVQERLKTSWKAAKVEYQKGFEPAAPPKPKK